MQSYYDFNNDRATRAKPWATSSAMIHEYCEPRLQYAHILYSKALSSEFFHGHYGCIVTMATARNGSLIDITLVIMHVIVLYMSACTHKHTTIVYAKVICTTVTWMITIKLWNFCCIIVPDMFVNACMTKFAYTCSEILDLTESRCYQCLLT